MGVSASEYRKLRQESIAKKAQAEVDQRYQSQLDNYRQSLQGVLDGYDKTAHAADAQAGWTDYNATQKQIAQNKQKAEKNKSWLDKLGEYLGGVQDTSLPVHMTGEVTKGVQAQDQKLNYPTDDWSEDQQLTFGYLWKTNRQKAWEYGRMINTERKRQAEQAKIQQIQDAATDNFGAGVGHTVGAILSAPLGLADTMGDMIEMGALGHLSRTDGEVTPGEYSEVVKSGISQHLNEKGGTLSEDIPIVGGKGWGDVYNLGTSVTQSMLAAHTGGGGQALITSFGPTVQSGINSAKSRGATDEQAMSFGLMSGLAEALAEQVGVDNLLKIGSASTMKELALNILKQGAAEGLEEGITSVATNFADQLVMADKSEYNIAVIMYMTNGMSKEDAQKQAWLDMAEGVLFDMLAGFASGGVSGGLETGVKNVTSKTQSTTTQTTATQSQMPQSFLTDLVDEAIARATNAPTDPLSAAVDGYKATGTVTNNQARDILNNTKAITQLIQQTGIKLPDTASGRRNAVKQAVAQLAQQAQTGSQADVLPGSENDTSAQNAPAQEASTAQPQTYTDELLSEISAPAEGALTDTNAISKPLNSYPAEKQNTIRSYIRSVDQRIKAFVQRVKSGDLSFKRQKIADVSARAVVDISNLLGVDVSGYTHNINTNGIQHILNRHGENGAHDKTMSLDDDIARVGWVLENYDSVELLTNNGEQVYSSQFRDRNNNLAPQIRFVKKIDGSYYVVEAVFENDYKKLWVQSAYLTKKEDVTQVPAEGQTANHETNARSALASPSSDNSIPQSSANVNPTESVGAAPGGSKVSKLHSNTYANATGEAVRGIGQRVQELDPNIARYDPVTEKQSSSEAVGRSNSPEARAAEIENLLSKDGWTAADNDTAYIILDKLRQEGDTVNFAALAAKQRQQNTTGGQLIQSNAKYTRENLTKRTADAFNTLSDLTEWDVPRKFWKDGGFDAWKKEVSRTVLDISNKLEQAAENGSAEDIKQIIRSLAQFRRTTAWFGTSSNLTKVAEKGLNHIDADTAKAMAMAQISQIPEDFRKRPMGQVAETIRVHNMLAALTTVNRNLFGNGVIGLVDATSDSTAGRWADILLSKLTGKRTVGNDLTQGKAYLDAAAKSAAMAALCVELDIPMDSDSRFTEGTTRTFSPQGGPVTRFLSAYEKAMKYALEVTDQFFSGGTAGAVDQSLQSLSDKAGLTDEERAELARQTGLRRTFKEDRTLSHMATKVKQGLNEAKIVDGLALGNAVMAFARTGSNVTQTGADYTGAGLVIGLKEAIQLRNDLKNGKYKNGEKIVYAKDGKTVKERISLAQAQRRAATNIGRGITGVGTVALFAAAALCGILKVHNDEDKDAKALDQSNNLSGAQLNLSALLRSLAGEDADWQTDDCVISMDFLEPFNSQMYLGYALSQEETMADILKAYPEAAVSSIWQSVLDMPMMQGLSEVADLAKDGEYTDAAGQLMGDYATGFIPSWMRQTAQWIDPYYRDTTGENVWEKAGNQITSRIPFLSQTLPKKVDGLGREQLRHNGDFMGFLNTFVNPGEIEHINVGELESFIDGVSKSSGNLEVYPRSTLPNELTYEDENGRTLTRPLRGYDREIYQKAYGKTVTRVYSDLMDMDDFYTLAPENQVAVMKAALSYAAKLSESSVAGWHEEPAYITNRPEGMSEAEAILRQAVVGTTEKYTDLPISAAAYTDALLKSLQKESKEDGTSYSSIRDIQKMEAVVADHSLTTYTDALLRDIMPDSTEAKYDNALNKGFTAEQFVGGYRQYIDTTGEDKRLSVIRYCQREMGMSYAAAKKLYEIYSTKATEE